MKSLLQMPIFSHPFINDDDKSLVRFMLGQPVGNETTETTLLLDKYGGVQEYRTWDGSRIDIYDEEVKIAYEVDWLDKWKEAFGQASLYASLVVANPAVILLIPLDMPVDEMRKYRYRATLVSQNLCIPVFYEYAAAERSFKSPLLPLSQKEVDKVYVPISGHVRRMTNEDAERLGLDYAEPADQQVAELKRQATVAGDRRDWDAVNEIEAKIDAFKAQSQPKLKDSYDRRCRFCPTPVHKNNKDQVCPDCAAKRRSEQGSSGINSAPEWKDA